MRENKYRAWNGKKYLGEFTIEDAIAWGCICGHGRSHEFYGADILEQFTGLKDKNGKEIYEGDICKIVVDDTTDDYSISTVKFHDGAFTVDADFGEYDTSAIGWAITDCENGGGYIQVLGNIHENPELMEKSEPK